MINRDAGSIGAGHHAHQARKSAGRLLLSGVGFSAAYFLDPESGTARRRHARAVLGHARRTIARSRFMNVDPNISRWRECLVDSRLMAAPAHDWERWPDREEPSLARWAS